MKNNIISIFAKYNIQKVYIFMLLFLLTNPIASKAINISGAITNNEIFPYNVRIENNDSISHWQYQSAFYTNKFILNIDKKGKCEISILLNDAVVYNCSVELKDKDIELKEINIPKDIALKEVVVKSKKMQVKRTGMDYTISNIQGTLLGEAGNLLEMLKWTPGIMVGSDNTISVIGRSTPEVYIDDRLVQDEAQLIGLQSSQVSKIEVIRDPGVRYSSGTSAVIKIHTRRNIQDFFAVSVDNKTGLNRKLNTGSGIALSGKTGKLTGNLSFNYRHGNVVQYKDAETEIKYSESDIYKDVSNSKTTLQSDMYTVYGGINYNLSSKNLFILQYSGSFINHKPYKIFTTHNLFNHGIEQVKEDTETASKMKNSVNTVTAGYTHKRNKTSTLNLTATYQNKDANTDKILQEKNITTNNLLVTDIFSKTLYNIYTFVGDYSFKVNDKNSEYVGISAGQINNTNDMTTNEKIQDTKRNDTWIAAFANVSHDFTKKFNASLGLRYEYNSYKYNMPNNEYIKDCTSKVLPNLKLSYRKSNSSSYTFNYSRSVGFPSISQLSSVVTYIDDTHCTTGNPYLKPVTGDRFRIAANLGDLTTELSFSHWGNKIINTMLLDDNSDLITYKPINSDYLNSYSLKANYTIEDDDDKYCFDFFGGLEYDQLKYQANGNIYKTNQVAFYLSGDIYWNITKIFKCYADFYYHSPWLIDDQHVGYQLDVNVGVSATLLKRSLRIALEGSDLFRRAVAPTSYERNYLNISEKVSNSYDGRGISLSIRYSFDSHKVNFRMANSNSTSTTRAD